MEEIDLTYEGITTHHAILHSSSLAPEEIDLTYEGITTLLGLFSFFHLHK